MEGKKQCVRCGREIDEWAKICPFCNWEQEMTPPAPVAPAAGPEATEPAPAARPLKEKLRMPRWSSQALFLAAIGALLLATFAIGGLVIGLGSRGDRLDPKVDIDQSETQQPPRRVDELGDLTLVPENDPTATIGRSVTTTPMPSPDAAVDTAYDRRDATALPSQEYSRILQSAPQQPEPASGFEPVDPRTIAGNVHQPQPAAPRPPAPPRRAAAERRETARSDDAGGRRTRPVPVSQPLPNVRNLKEGGTLAFNLTVGADGRVKEVDIIKTVPQLTARMIEALHRWKFKPATRNGEPVEGTFHVEISFNADE